MNLGMLFLQKYNLKMIYTEGEVLLMPVKDRSTSKAKLVDRGCHSLLSKKSGTILQATKDQMILMQVWRIPQERISINMLSERWKRLWEFMQRITVRFPWARNWVAFLLRIITLSLYC